MTTRTTIAVAGAAGGSGCTTIAATLALNLTATGPVRLHDLARGDVAAVLGAGVPDIEGPTEVTERLTITRLPAVAAGATLAEHLHAHDPAGSEVDGVDVVDLGAVDLLPLRDDGARIILAVRGPSYTSLRHALALAPVDVVAVLTEPGRALDLGDVAAVLDVPAVAVPWDPAVSRAIDAGIFPSRRPRSHGAAVARLLDPATV